MLPIQRQDTLTGGSAPLEVTMIIVFINLTEVVVQSNLRKQNITSLLGGAHFHQLLQTSFKHMKFMPSSALFFLQLSGGNPGQIFYCTFH